MKKVSKAITIYVEGNSCNLQCEYCYQKNSNPTEKSIVVNLLYPIDEMIRAFSPKRLGSLAEITVIGCAETLLTQQIIPFVHGLLEYGHVVTVVTNATLSERIDRLLDCSEECLQNLILKCSFHYRELIKKELLNTYFINIKKALNAGASAYPFVVICQDYVNEFETISKIMMDNLGIQAHCSPCTEVNNSFDLRFGANFNPMPNESLMEQLDKYFDTRIYKECIKYKSVDVQSTFCYAGSWSICIDFMTGKMCKCHGCPVESGNFYQNIDEPFIWKEPIAMSCAIESCALQYNFFSEGLMPDKPCKYTYGKLIYIPSLISEYLRDKLDVSFSDIYRRLSKEDETIVALKNKNIQIRRLQNEILENPFVNPKIREMSQIGKKIAILGTGRIYEKYKSYINFPVDCYLDSYLDGTKHVFNDKEMKKPIELIENADDYFIVVAVKDKESIFESLIELGFKSNNFC